MPTAHLHVSGVLREAALFVTRLRAGHGPRFLEAEVEAEDDELVLFEDHDEQRGHGEGFYAADEAECQSRWLDMRQPHDFDSGPIEMEEGTTSPDVVVLSFKA